MISHPRPVIGLLLLTAVVLAACDPGVSASAPSPSGRASASTAAGSTMSSPPASGSAKTSQTDTDWGRIWDALPKGFPNYPGATPADEAATGAASAVLVVDGADANDIATFFQMRLDQAGYDTVGLQGPLENGGYVVDMTGPPADCMLQVTAAPTGGLTTVTILYGAACPFG